jgi:hypothetical protein
VHRRLVLSLVTVFSLLRGVASGDGVHFKRWPAHSSWANEATALPPQGRKIPDARIMCHTVYLISKGNMYVTAGERQFTLLPGAVLQDAQKKPLTLHDIRLPCHASLCYYRTPNRRDACIVSLSLMPERGR